MTLWKDIQQLTWHCTSDDGFEVNIYSSCFFFRNFLYLTFEHGLPKLEIFWHIKNIVYISIDNDIWIDFSWSKTKKLNYKLWEISSAFFIHNMHSRKALKIHKFSDLLEKLETILVRWWHFHFFNFVLILSLQIKESQSKKFIKLYRVFLPFFCFWQGLSDGFLPLLHVCQFGFQVLYFPLSLWRMPFKF